MGRPSTWALGAVLVATLPSLAQSEGSKDAPRPNHAEVRFGDGSLVRVTLLQDTLDVMTKYGKLTIPIRDIRRIDFGLHLPLGADAQIDTAIKQLGSEAYREREDAVKNLLHLGHVAYPFLQKASRNPDLEVSQRASGLMKRIADKATPELLRLKEEDNILTQEFPLVGKILSPSIKVHSLHFGEMALKLSDLRTLFVRGQAAEGDLVVDAAKYGSAADQWFDSGLIVDPSQRVLIVGEGQVDLWPQGPGQYVTTPKGYTAAGKGGTFMAGSLLARIGETGKPFLVGERYEGAPSDEGKLYFHIVPSPWNNASTGLYRVRLSTEHVALSAKR